MQPDGGDRGVVPEQTPPSGELNTCAARIPSKVLLFCVTASRVCVFGRKCVLRSRWLLTARVHSRGVDVLTSMCVCHVQMTSVMVVISRSVITRMNCLL